MRFNLVSYYLFLATFLTLLTVTLYLIVALLKG